ncbi:hypothetical protein HYQ46_011622 [Verticillium longisporum]|nr:hypothetical protein HYQ44_003355 [Verticillium longisporum]KAG7152530.1 hypothetical protein HYQ46_011622 [Verticillium longisporum]
MEKKYGFFATKRQYVYRLGLWGCRKYGQLHNASSDSGNCDDDDDEDYDDVTETNTSTSFRAMCADNDAEGLFADTTPPEDPPALKFSLCDESRLQQKLAADLLCIVGDYATASDMYLQYSLSQSSKGGASQAHRLNLINYAHTARGNHHITTAKAMIQGQINALDGPSARRFFKLLKAVGVSRLSGGDPEALDQELQEVNEIMLEVEDSFVDDNDDHKMLSISHQLIDMNALVLLCRAEQQLTSREGGHATEFKNAPGMRDKYVKQQLQWTFQHSLGKSIAMHKCLEWCHRPRAQVQDRGCSSIDSFMPLWSIYAKEACNSRRAQPPWYDICEAEMGISPTALLYTLCRYDSTGRLPAPGSLDIHQFIKRYLDLFVTAESPSEGMPWRLCEIRQLVSQTLYVHLPRSDAVDGEPISSFSSSHENQYSMEKEDAEDMSQSEYSCFDVGTVEYDFDFGMGEEVPENIITLC